MVIFKGCTYFTNWLSFFHFTNFDFMNPRQYLSNTHKYFISQAQPVLAKFLKYKSLENFHLYNNTWYIRIT